MNGGCVLIKEVDWVYILREVLEHEGYLLKLKFLFLLVLMINTCFPVDPKLKIVLTNDGTQHVFGLTQFFGGCFFFNL